MIKSGGEGLNLKLTAEVKLEGGLSFRFTALEGTRDVTQLVPEQLLRQRRYASGFGKPIPFIGARFLYFDRVNSNDEDIHLFAIQDETLGNEPDKISCRIGNLFNWFMGHGLSQQDLDLCCKHFCSGIQGMCSEIEKKTGEFGARQINFYTCREGLRESRYFDPEKEGELEFYCKVGHRRFKKVEWARPGEKPIVVCSSESDCCCECAICLEELPVGDIAIRLVCSHYFHLHCIFQWVSMAQSCPLCRFPIPNSPYDFYHYFPYYSFPSRSVADMPKECYIISYSIE